MGFSFGSYDKICASAPLLLCPLLGKDGTGIEATCYSRNVEVGGEMIFQPATSFIHIVALIMTIIMVLHIRSKYTAVGRKEILLFFYLYAGIEVLAAFLDSGIIPTSSTAYPYFVAVHDALTTAAVWCLLLNGFVGFQFAEDGTPASLWTLRLSSLVIFGISFFISIATFRTIGPFSPSKDTGLWIINYLFNLACVVVYVIAQFILVIRTLDDRWPLGDILFAAGFFAAGQVIIYGFSVTICDAVSHYVDGLFFGTLCTLLSVMMIYKYWDSITKEDLEFSVGSKQQAWEIKGSLLGSEGADEEYFQTHALAHQGNYPPNNYGNNNKGGYY